MVVQEYKSEKVKEINDITNDNDYNKELMIILSIEFYFRNSVHIDEFSSKIGSFTKENLHWLHNYVKQHLFQDSNYHKVPLGADNKTEQVSYITGKIRLIHNVHDLLQSIDKNWVA